MEIKLDPLACYLVAITIVCWLYMVKYVIHRLKEKRWKLK